MFLNYEKSTSEYTTLKNETGDRTTRSPVPVCLPSRALSFNKLFYFRPRPLPPKGMETRGFYRRAVQVFPDTKTAFFPSKPCVAHAHTRLQAKGQSDQE